VDIVPDLIGFACSRFPDRDAVIAAGRSLTFAEVDERAARLAAVFTSRGLVPGDRVAILAMNEVEYLEVQVAAMRAGLILVPLNFRLALPELAYIIGDASPSLLICGSGYAAAGERLKVAEQLVLGGSYDEALARSDRSSGTAPIRAGAPSTILYTSGTTGRPKGAVISNHALFARINANLFEYNVSSDDRFLQCLPLFHIASNVTSTYAYAGASQVLLPNFDPALLLETIVRQRITVVLLVPTMINAVVNYPGVADFDLGTLRQIAYGASPIPPVVLQHAIRIFGCGFVQLFGMTETSACTVLRPADHDPDRHPGLLASAGTPALSFAVRVVDDDDRDVAAGAVGEVICRGPAVMDGYWNNPEATAAALRHGWMHTGDVGYRDADGYLFISDRKKDMIVTGGENVYPREVEDVLFEHPQVLEAAVIGVPDERWGERVHAVLVSTAGAGLDVAEVLSFARDRLAGYKVPKTAEIVTALPKNATGKVLKQELRAPWWQGHQRGVT